MGLKTTWAEDCTLDVSPEQEAILRKLEDDLRLNGPPFYAAMERWSQSTDEKEKIWYTNYMREMEFAERCFNEETGLLDVVEWRTSMPDYVKPLHVARRWLFAKVRCAINDTPIFQIGYEPITLKGGLKEFIEPPEHYSTEEKMKCISAQLSLRFSRIQMGDRRLENRLTVDSSTSSDVLARSFLYHWFQGLENWLLRCDLLDLWNMPIGTQPHKDMNIGQILVAQWSLFWDNTCTLVFDCFGDGNYDEYTVLNVVGSDQCFEIDDGGRVLPGPCDEHEEEAFNRRRAYFTFALAGRRRRYVVDLAPGHPMVPKRRGASLPFRNSSRQSDQPGMPWTRRRRDVSL